MSDFVKTTELDSKYRHLEKMPTMSLLESMNREDATVAEAVQKTIPQIEKLVEAIVGKMKNGGRLFYIGAGTSGRLGVLDASECPPTFGVSKDLVVGIIAGGETALRNPVENAEDDTEQAWIDLAKHHICGKDILVGLATSGTTPYVIAALEKAQEEGILTGSIACNEHSPISDVADFPIEVIVGPEFLTGSTRLKSGTAQKMILNMISTTTMIRLGKVEDNKMVNMQLSNEKLVDRGAKMLMQQLNLKDYEEAVSILLKYGNVANSVKQYKAKPNESNK